MSSHPPAGPPPTPHDPRPAPRTTRPLLVLFDLGNVLCAFDWPQSLARLAARLVELDPARAPAPGQIVDWLLGEDGPLHPYCRGEIDEAQLWSAFHERLDPRRRLDDAWLQQLWCTMFSPLPASLALVDALRGQVRLGLLSNTNRLHFEHLDFVLRLRERFDAVTLSYAVGALKPDPRIYHAALAAAGIAAEEAFFVDDVPEFVAAACAQGMRATVFSGAGKLALELRALGFSLP